jgi:hypothetical protein
MASTPQHPNLAFPPPNAAALTLDAAFRSAAAAAGLWPQISFPPVITPHGQGAGIPTTDVTLLFDFFSGAIAAVGSSFQAIEAFANETIARNLTGTMTLKRRKRTETLTAAEIERHLSTEEKITIVLPDLLKVPSIKGGRHWTEFSLLKAARDNAIHFKSGDQYPPGGRLGKESLYSLLLNNDPRAFPLIALRVIWDLRQRTGTPRWLDHLAERHGVT